MRTDALISSYALCHRRKISVAQSLLSVSQSEGGREISTRTAWVSKLLKCLHGEYTFEHRKKTARQGQIVHKDSVRVFHPSPLRSRESWKSAEPPMVLEKNNAAEMRQTLRARLLHRQVWMRHLWLPSRGQTRMQWDLLHAALRVWLPFWPRWMPNLWMLDWPLWGKN